MSVYLPAAQVAWKAQALCASPSIPPICVTLGCSKEATYEPLTFNGQSYFPARPYDKDLFLATRCSDCAHKGLPIKPLIEPEEKQEPSNKRSRPKPKVVEPTQVFVIILIEEDGTPSTYTFERENLETCIGDESVWGWIVDIKIATYHKEKNPWEFVEKVIQQARSTHIVTKGWDEDLSVSDVHGLIIKQVVVIPNRRR